MINKVIILGNLGSDAEMRNGAATMKVATNNKFKDKNGELVEKTEWHNIVCFGKLAEIIQPMAVKGKRVYVEGRIETKEHDGKWYTDIIANQVRIVN